MRLAVLCVMSILGGTSMATQERVPDMPPLGSPRLGPLFDKATKRAYTYRANYKRLPNYEFGIGKRWVPLNLEDKRKEQFTFGMGKRARGFDIGIGKRSSYYEVPAALDYYQPLDQESLGVESQGKRGPRNDDFVFGIGKRDALLDYLREGKLSANHPRDKPYLLGLGQRFYEPEDEQLDEDAA